MKKVDNYARFYTLLRSMAHPDKDTLKELLVAQYTTGRTTSLREMEAHEYNNMCNAMQREVNAGKAVDKNREQIRFHRSTCLKLMQKYGIDTTDWTRVDNFTRNPRIAGKEFRKLTIDELKIIATKLRVIIKKKEEGEAEADALLRAQFSRVRLQQDNTLN